MSTWPRSRPRCWPPAARPDVRTGTRSAARPQRPRWQPPRRSAAGRPAGRRSPISPPGRRRQGRCAQPQPSLHPGPRPSKAGREGRGETVMSADILPGAAGPEAAAGVIRNETIRNETKLNQDLPAAGPAAGRCRRPGCHAPLPPQSSGRPREFCSEQCRHRHNNSLRGAVAAPPPPGEGASAALGRLSQLLAQAAQLAALADQQVADAAPEKVAALAAEAEAARRQAEARAAVAEAQASQARESAAAAWEAADAAEDARSAAEASADAAEAQARELAERAAGARERDAAAGAARQASDALAAERAACADRNAAARELATAASDRAQRAEAALEAERAERRALTERLVGGAVPVTARARGASGSSA